MHFDRYDSVSVLRRWSRTLVSVSCVFWECLRCWIVVLRPGVLAGAVSDCTRFASVSQLRMLFLCFSYPILFNPSLSYRFLSYLILTYPNLSYPILTYPILPYPSLSYPIS